MEPWYSEGVHFRCTQCGGCCTGGPGAVWVSDQELRALAQFLRLSTEETEQRYCRFLDGRRALQESGQEYDCIFLKEQKRCSVYPARPIQCQTFPFWPGVMSNLESWQQAARYCEGIDPQAPRVERSEIEQQLARSCRTDPSS